MPIKLVLLSFGLLLGIGQTSGQVYLLDGSNTGQTYNTCSGTFFDSGSSSGEYSNNENYTITFCSSNADPIVVDFDFIDIENNFDYLFVYDGPSDASPQMTGSPLTGASSPTFTASGTCITFVFQTDFSVTYPGWQASISCGTVVGDDEYNNPGGNINTCSGNFFDTGGSSFGYNNNQNITTTFCADQADQCISLNFSSFDIESGFDQLEIYDGASTGSPLIGSFTGTASPGNVTATGSCLTFRFTSDGSVTYSGWQATISCSDCDAPPDDAEPPACPSIDIIDDLALDCATPCVDLSAEVTETGQTSNYSVSSVAYDPPYPFTGGTPLFIGTDDIWSSLVNLPFNFCFYGNTYSDIVVGANGLISFDATYANAFCPWQFTETVPDANLPLNSIFGAYHDLDPSMGGDINYAILGTAPCRTFVVNYNNVPHYSCDCSIFGDCNTTTQQIVIYETTNIIDVYVLDKETCGSWNSGNAVIGIQDDTGANGLTPPGRNTGPWTASNEAWRFTPDGPPNYVINWYDDQNALVGTGPSVNVCPSQTTTYTGEVVYTNCDNAQVIETDVVTVDVAESFTLDATITDESCAGACDGSVEITTTDGQAPFTFDIGSGPQNNGLFENLCAGDYEVEVTDANDCVVVEPVTIATPPVPDPGQDNTWEVCENDPSFDLFDQLGGTPDTGGQWLDPNGDPFPGPFDPASSTPGTYTYELGDPGCIYSANVTVTVNPILTSTQDFTICDGESVTLPDGTQVNTTGTYDVTLISAITGCDSVVTTDVTVNPLLSSTTEVEICDGESHTLPDGTQVTASGNYDVTLSSVITGCDSTVTTNVIVNPLLTSTTEVTICDGETVTLPDGTQVTSAGSYDVTLPSLVTGCDSTITTDVTVDPLLSSTTDITICDGESTTLPDGTQVSTAGSYDVTLSSVITGCDSTVTANVSVNPLLSSTADVTICDGESVTLPDGSQVSAAGSYEVTLSSVVTGCDSTVTTNVTVNPLLSSTADVTICDGESATLPDGTQVSSAGSYDIILSSMVTGCDSTITTNVIVNPLLTSTTDVAICDGESVTLPGGSQVSAAGSYDVTLSSVVTGCDSTITTNVIVNPLLTSTQDVTICDGESVTLPDGTQVSATGSYDVTLSSVVTGCDSTVTTNVTVNPLLSSTEDVTICDGESVTLPDGSQVSSAGTYDVTLSSVVTGCDSMVTTNVAVNPLLSSVNDVTICDGASATLPDGSQVSSAGSYDITLSSVVTGCDSTVTTNVVVNPLLTSTTDVTICDGESVTLPDGTQITAAGSYDIVLSSVVTGCDSTITTNVIVNTLLTSTTDVTICDGESVTLPDGTEVSSAGSYDVTLSSVVTGCDSTITTNVTVNPLLSSTTDVSICDGESYTLPDGTQVSATGSYDVTQSSAVTGCDSTITTNVTVNPLLSSTTDITICDGESVTLPDGTQVSAAANYDVVLSSVLTGCDSTVTTNVTVNPLLASTADVTICDGESVTLPDGSQVSTAGSYDVTLSSAITGCDSTVTTNVAVNPLLSSTTDVTICDGESVTLPNGTQVTTAGSYDVTLSSAVTGCDSTVTTNVIVNPLLSSTTDVTICADEFVTLPDGTQVNTSGSYDVTLSSVITGCDSTVTTNVAVNELISVDNLEEDCATSGTTYTLSFEISGGDAATYSVTGITGSITPGAPAVFESDPIAEGTSYDITVEDGNACNSINLTGTVSCNCPAEGELVGGATICEGEDATLTFNFNGNGPFSATYSDGNSTYNLTNVSDGHAVTVSPSTTITYTLVSMSDANCSGNTDGSATITVNTPPDAGTDSQLTICENDGTANLFNELGGSPDGSGTWTDPIGDSFTNPFDPTANLSGTYTYTVLGDAPCPAASAVVIVDILETIAVDNLIEDCSANGATYTVSFEISDGDPSSYEVSGLAGSISPGNPAVFTSDPIASGTSYDLSVSDDNTCSIIELSGTVACDCPVSAEITGGNTICSGESATLTFNLSGTGPFDVEYTDGTDEFALNGISDGHTVSVSPGSSSTYTLVSVENAVCPGTVFGSAEIEVMEPPTAGLDGYIEVCADAGTESLFDLLGGTPDSGGTWTDPSGNVVSETFDPQSQDSGVYTYTISGDVCPDAAAEVEILIHELPQVEILGNASICDGNLANLEMNLDGNGTWTVIYAIDGEEQPPINTSDPDFELQTGQEGLYTIVSVEDDHCTGAGSGNGTVSINDSPTAEISGQGAICPGEEANLNIELDGEGPWDVIYTIDGVEQPPLAIDDPNFTLTTEEPGVYELQSVNDANCPGSPSGSAEVEYLPYPEATISGGGSICPGDSVLVEIDLSGEGDILVEYSDGNTSESITAQDGSFSFYAHESADFELISVSDELCAGIVDGDASVEVLEIPTASISGGGVICEGESTPVEIDFTGEAPFDLTYSIDGVEQSLQIDADSAVLNVDSPGTYELIGVNDALCSNTASGTVSISVNELPSGVMTGGGEICAGENEDIQIDLTGAGNWEFVIAFNGETEPSISTNITPYVFNSDQEGYYELISVSDLNCPGTAEGEAEIDVNDLPTATLSGDESICGGEPAELSLELTGDGPWTIGYTLDGVQQPPMEVDNPAYDFTVSEPGEYALISVADQHCIGSVEGTANVTAYPAPTADISGNAVICPTESASFEVNLTGSGPWMVVYSIDGAEQPPIEVDSTPFELEANSAGTYEIESVQDVYCDNFGTGTAELEYAPYPTATLTGGGTFCPGDMGNVAILFTGDGPWTFEYAIDDEVFGPITTSSNSYTLFDDITGTYSLVTVSDAFCGGTVEGEADVVFNGTPQVEISPGGQACPGEFVDLWTGASGGVPPYSFQWFNSTDDSWVQFEDSVSVLANSTSGIYVVATDQCGSTAISDTSWVMPHQVPLASFHFEPRHDLTVLNTTINFSSETSLFEYSLNWEFYENSDYHGWQQIGSSYDTNPTFTFPDDEPGEYQTCLYVTTAEGCVNEVCLPLEIAGEFSFYMPNAFTPNEDGINDLFGPVMEGIDPDSFEFFIVNRWGETVFYTDDIEQKWNGSGMDGTHYAQDGIYSWKVKVRQLNASESEEYEGHVTLIR